ncbi:TonB-dependent siderophore receptor [Methylomonas koyamae]|uniref:TonB-dependent siderophore receptor n=1 Tax=Methylomonas koyamae TaxID=702114 RepID=UPI002872C7DC|nr:TonB-dependent siderophore receptor [Methylomonas koyamae]WNB75753.1 TonB-dependent siderophore receptor [Methylomonas koyamae]
MSPTKRRCRPGFQSSRLQQAVKGMLLLSALTVSAAPYAESDADTLSVKHSYHIGGGSLSQVLSQFATASGLLFVAEARLTEGKTSAGLDGDYTVEEGFRKLLAGSGLTHAIASDKTVTLKIAQPQPQSGTTAMPAVTVVGKAVYDSTDPYNEDYRLPNANTATKTDTPLMETPTSIQVVPRAVLDDQQAIRLDEATKNVSGVQAPRQLGVLFDNFMIRGFTTPSFNVYRDGLRLGQQSFETSSLEQIEIFKGPPSTLFGRSAPGGLVNMVTKKPLFTPYYSISQQFGSYDLYRTTLDATGALDDDKTLAYRMNFSYMDANSFRDFVGRDRVFVAPQLTWKPSDAFEINAGYEYKKDNITGDRGIPAVGDRPANVPISRFIGEPNFSLQAAESHLAHLDWTYRFNDDWKLQQRFVANILDTFNQNIVPRSLQVDNRTVNRGLFSGLTQRATYAQDFNLNGKFKTLGIGHNVLLGLDYYRFDESREATILGPTAPFMTTIDIYNPVYGSLQVPGNLAKNNFVAQNQEWYGLYFQDQIDLTDDLHFLFSGRHDWATTRSGVSSTAAPTLNEATAEKFSPRLGLTYQPVKWLSFFANWTEALGATNGRSSTGQPLPSELAEQFEGGVKTEFFDGRLIASLAAYELTKNNVLTDDTSTVDPFDQIAIGQSRSHGLEFDFSGELTEKWKVIGSYAYTDVRILKDSGQFGSAPLAGNRLPNAPEHSASLWTSYDLTDGFKIGTGAYIAGKRQANTANNWQLPGYVRWDAMAAYQWHIGKSRMTAQVNVNNILDKRYYAYADEFGHPRFDAMPGEPITVLGSLKLEY